MTTTTATYLEATPIPEGDSWAHQVVLQGVSAAGELSPLKISDLTAFTLVAYDVASDVILIGTPGLPGAEPTPEDLLATLSPGGNGTRGSYDDVTGTLTLVFHEADNAMVGTAQSEVHRALVVASYNGGQDASVYELTYTVQAVRHRAA